MPFKITSNISINEQTGFLEYRIMPRIVYAMKIPLVSTRQALFIRKIWPGSKIISEWKRPSSVIKIDFRILLNEV
jgi:hypothetical protein